MSLAQAGFDDVASQGPLVRVRNIRMTYGRPPAAFDVLHGIDLDVRAGQVTLIVGASGSGKTTLLTIMGLLLRPTAGTVTLCGADMTSRTEAGLAAVRRNHVSFVFQSFNLLSALTAPENVQVALSLQGLHDKAAASRAAELLARVGLGHRTNHRPDQLSGGEKQRVGIARALASPAKLILADEPTGNLDGRTSLRIATLLRDITHEENRATVIVTHDARLEPFADRILQCDDGRISDRKGVVVS